MRHDNTSYQRNDTWTQHIGKQQCLLSSFSRVLESSKGDDKKGFWKIDDMLWIAMPQNTAVAWMYFYRWALTRIDYLRPRRRRKSYWIVTRLNLEKIFWTGSSWLDKQLIRDQSYYELQQKNSTETVTCGNSWQFMFSPDVITFARIDMIIFVKLWEKRPWRRNVWKRIRCG